VIFSRLDPGCHIGGGQINSVIDGRGRLCSGLPKSMTSIAIREPGGPDMLVPREEPVPLPGEGEILVRVAAAGVNRPDVMQRQGHYPPPKGATEIPGLEIAGEVARV
jgi:D-arabinose 1-dehydrogenase-like Zn-dependent alcohol dehydrogenase